MTNLTICNSTAVMPHPPTADAAETPLRKRSEALPPVRAVETRAFFRCAHLAATLSVEQCRSNRGRMTPQQLLALPYDVPEWWVQPLPCWSCTLAPVVEAGSVSFYSAEEVLAGAAREAAEPQPAHPSRRGRRDSQGGQGGHRPN